MKGTLKLYSTCDRSRCHPLTLLSAVLLCPGLAEYYAKSSAGGGERLPGSSPRSAGAKAGGLGWRAAGLAWINRHVHGLFAISGPFLGAPKSFRSTLMGEDMGLGAFLSASDTLTLCRSMGSAPWLMPSIPHQLSAAGEPVRLPMNPHATTLFCGFCIAF